MSAVERVVLRRGAYADSVALMAVSQEAGRLERVRAAMAAMATDLNVDLLRGLGFDLPPDVGGASPDDLVVAVRADDDAALEAALAHVDAALARRSPAGGPGGAGGSEAPPRTVRAAARRVDATLALVSVPGRAAFAEAMDALDAGLSVMVFSDNVPVALEVRLKDAAAERGLLVMGPDCGTAVVGGVGLGFANAVEPGPVGIVAASGTGAQQLMCLLAAGGVGVRHCLGVGGRDLSAAVGARSTLQALAALDADPRVESVLVVSKPPAPEVAAAVEKAAAGCATPVLLALLGRDRPDLSAVAAEVLRSLGRDIPGSGGWPSWRPERPPEARGGSLRGLFSGGTLCDEAMVLAAAALGPVRSNIPLEPGWAVGPDLRADGHLMLDLGDDDLTRGRPHPMIDSTVRRAHLEAALRDPTVGVVLLDVVLGHGAHPDPAADLAPVLSGAEVPVVVSLCGTAGDPQGLERQAGALVAAGAEVHLSNAAAARRAVELTRGAAE